VTFALLGSLAVGCGGAASTGTAGNGSGSGQPPNTASDSAPNNNSDQAPTSSDQAPTNSDKPPASSETPAGTGDSLGALCRRFCDELTTAATRCKDDLEVTGCDGPNACKVPPTVIPCADEIGDFIGCAIDNLQSLCQSTDSPGPGNNTGGTTGNAPLPPQQTSPCEDSLKRYTECAKVHGITDSNNMMTGDMPKGCYTAGGCEMCATDCQKCQCDANGDLDKLQACVNDQKCP
jgi:hypothetical protein